MTDTNIANMTWYDLDFLSEKWYDLDDTNIANMMSRNGQ